MESRTDLVWRCSEHFSGEKWGLFVRIGRAQTVVGSVTVESRGTAGQETGNETGVGPLTKLKALMLMQKKICSF